MTFDMVRDVIVDTLGCDPTEVTLEANLVEDLGADSLATVEMVMALEEAADITIEDEVAAQIKTVADILKYVG